MMENGPLVVETLPYGVGSTPAMPSVYLNSLTELDRFEWYVGQPGDPAELVQRFLTDHGLGQGALHPTDTHTGPAAGAALYVSAAAGATMIGAPPGAPSPAPAVPDVVAVAFRDRPGRPRPADRQPPTDWWLGPWQPSWTPQAHAAAVTAARAAIGRGDIYQVNVVGHTSARYTGDPLPALTRLGQLSGARYGGILTGAGWAIGCASPETLIEVSGGRIVTRPIKGTRPATAPGRVELLTSTKERAEHIMIVDLERNDLARIAATGSVHVDELYRIRQWCDLWQAESTVSARAADGLTIADLLRAVCPGGSVTGAPKVSALHQIAALEPVGRGAGMGALGWVGPHHIDLGLTIRTAAADGERLHVWAGGGITWDSDPDAEVAEAAAKAGPVRAILAAGPPH
ncbi:para-aminobenzoate synthetase component 1 [Micromonospora pisi]|uniref:Para-aminobenzoate synthetase component 1 n=1 Tax=Micromonospora pisi TaxID=589240 RepID=A0A495JXW3_9ACTN|nr:para-aminobenzoate synthetase component 1 [Micromonospora pisi]